MGFPMATRAVAALVVALAVMAPLPGVHFSQPADGEHAVAARPADVHDPDRPLAQRFVDPVAGVAITPPAGWLQGPASALNPVSDPPEPVQEVARFQLRVSDPQLYAAPIPITSGLVADAVAILSIGVAREGSDVLAVDRGARGTRELGSVPGFTTLEDETTYEGLHVMTRYLFSRDGDRVLVARAAALEDSWTVFGPQLRAALLSFGGDPHGANAPAPPPPAPKPVAVAEVLDPTVAVRNAIIQRAAALLGLRYVWGGNSTTNGMDCSAYVSWTWGVSRYTTDSIWNVSFPIGKEELRPGDALNLTTGRDPQHLGHIRLFDAWANAEHSAMWVYEETPPRVVHRVVAYDTRYQPIRLAGLSGAGEARLIPGAPEPSPTFRATPRPTRRVTPTPTRRPTPTATIRRTPSPSPSPSPTTRPATTTAPVSSGTARPSASPTPIPTR